MPRRGRGRWCATAEQLEPRRLLAAAGDLNLAFDDFADQPAVEAAFDWHGDAAVDFAAGRIGLTTDTRSRHGNLLSADKLALGPDTSFAARFTFKMTGELGGSGGDGLAFVAHNYTGGTGFLPVGDPGGTLGYAGLYPSLAVEFDTDQSFGDPDSNHVALHFEGNSDDAVQERSVGIDLNGGAMRHVWVDYDGPSDRLRVYLSDRAGKPSVPTLNYEVALDEMLEGEAWVGFTAANGWWHNRHEVHSFHFDGGEPETPNTAPVANADAATAVQNGGRRAVAVLDNDVDADGDALTIVTVTQGEHGRVETDGTRVYYTPELGYAGTDSFNYAVSDGRGGTASARVNVTVEQAAASGTLSLSSGSYRIGEGEGVVRVGVTRAGDTAGVATISYVTLDGSAEAAGGDYRARNGTLRFDAGQGEAFIEIAVLDDGRIEGDETFTVSLDRVTGADLGAPRTTLVTIIDDDEPADGGDDGLPWAEDFNLPDGTDVDDGATAWTLDDSAATDPARVAGVDGGRLVVSDTGGPVVWQSGRIDLGDGPASLSAVVQSVGQMEAGGAYRDWAELDYRVDGGPWVRFFAVDGTLNGGAPATARAEGVEGESVELRITSSTSSGSERYLFDDVTVAEAGTTAGGQGGGLRAEYFNERDLTRPALTRNDGAIDFNWGRGSPAPQVDGDTFSVRWTGRITAESAGTYTFHAGSDDGVRVWVGGEMVVDAWVNRGYDTSSGTADLPAGEPVDLKVEYYENSGAARATLEWESADVPRQIVPGGRLSPDGYGTGGDDEGGRDFRAVTVASGLGKVTDLAAVPASAGLGDVLFAATQDGVIKR